MNEASRWRYALAQQLTPHYSANPKVMAVLVGGSVAQGCADRSSDIDLIVFWSEPPTKQERGTIIKRARGRRGSPAPSHPEVSYWWDDYEVGGVTINVQHTTVQTTERLLAEVLKLHDPSLPKQQRLATLLCALPLANSSLVSQWQQQAAAYPHELSVAMVREHLRFRPGWELEMLAERHNLLLLYESLCTIEKDLLLVLMGLNCLHYPGWQWVDRLMGQMPTAPARLAPRFKQLFGIVSIDPRTSVYRIHDLIEETFRLVETQLGEIDTTRARKRFRTPRRAWEHAPDGLL
jgi:hypothetical protein